MLDRRLILSMLVALTALLALPRESLAQAVYGQIFGTVRDSSGGAVPGAEVTITDLDKGTIFTVITNESGNYTKTRLVPGRYQVKIGLTGFKSFVQDDVIVRADEGARVDAALEVGQLSEQVVITAEAPLLKSDRADVSTVFENKAVTELPLLNRNFTELQLLAPGTSKQTWQHASSENPQGSTQIMVNGQPFFGTGFLLDGTDNRDPILGIIVINPVLDSVQEFKMTTVNFDAEFGNAQSAVITSQTRSGTNELHGSVYEFHRNSATNARNPFSESPETLGGKRIPSARWNQFGATAGGPIVENKAFFFGYYEGTRQRNGSSVLTTVPTAAARAGDLSAYGRPIFNPRTGSTDGSGRTQFSGGIIPANQLSSQAQNLLKLLPVPNTGAAGAIENNYAAGGTEKLDSDQVGGRGDVYVTQNFHLFGRYSFANFNKFAPGAFGEGVGGPALNFINFAGRSHVRNQSVATGFDYTLNPSFLTDFRFGYFRYLVRVRPGEQGKTPARDAGIPGLNVNDFTADMPAFTINGVGTFRFGYSLGVNQCNCPLDQTEDQYQFVNNWTKIVRNHTLKFGVDYRRAINLRVPSDQHRSGQLSFNPEYTAGAGVANSGLGLASFLLGDVSDFRRYVSESLDAGERQNRYFLYGQDTWRVTQKLTLSLGLRWEYYAPETVSGPGKGANVDINTGEVVVYGVGPVPLDGGIEGSLDNFAPRLGIAYQLSEKTVLRMGYGRSYDIGTFGAAFGHTVTQNLPVLASQDLAPPSPFSSVFNLASGPPAPVFPTPDSNGRFKLPDGIRMFYIEPRLKLPFAENWNLSIQHQLTPTLAADIAYVGNQGVHRVAYLNFNLPRVGPGPVNPRRPFFDKFGWTQGIESRQCNCASSNYHSLQTKLEKRFANDFWFLGHYTWAKGFDTGLNGTDNIWDRRLEYGPTNFDRTHVFVLNGIWELPLGRGKKMLTEGVASQLLGGWSINNVLTLESGLPFSPGLSSRAPLNTPDLAYRPDILGDPELDDPTRDKWFNAGPSTIGTVWGIPAPLLFGNAARNSLRGPGVATLDLSLFKNFDMSETARLQLRAEFFNLFNSANLSNPNGTVDSPTAGQITGIFLPMRRIQWALRFVF
jgi:outer membrane receptor protein involved in Fe transport